VGDMRCLPVADTFERVQSVPQIFQYS
jgi:hypothetical protein